MLAEFNSVRIDKWLWAARFYKTRKLAMEAITGGKVHLNNQRTKPGKDIKPGDCLEINKNGYRWEITVLNVTPKRCSAKEAVLMYEESAESHEKRQLQIREEKERREFLAVNGLDRKPNKKERRLIHRFKQQ